jgi:hypothetical protein
MSVTASRSSREWLLLLFALPSTHAQARVRAWRRLQRVGAVLLKNSAYVLPAAPESREDFEWIRNEVVAAGGQAIVLVATAPDSAADADIVGTFRAARARDFDMLAAEASRLLERLPKTRGPGGRRALTQRVRRLRERFEETTRLDFFDTPAREKAGALVAKLDQHAGRKPPMAESATTLDRARFKGRTWLTRPHPGVDRMSSAWLIARFVDAKARFVFGDPDRQPGAIPFDTFQAEFGHHGSRCTFETLCERFGIVDPAIQRIGRIVHDLDLKESKYSEPEASTIGRLVDGLRRGAGDDESLLRSGMQVFEALYQSIASDGRLAGPASTPRATRVSAARGNARRS